jgi:hypothetical protein
MPGHPYGEGALAAACLVAFVLAWRRGWRVPVRTALAVTLGTRALMVALSWGHTPNDVDSYFRLAGELVGRGEDPLTRLAPFQWNFLPLMPYVFAAEQWTGLPWPVAGKIVPVLADVAVTGLLARLATGPDAGRVPLLWALCPVPLLVTGLHGQVEPVALALGLAALVLAGRARPGAAGLVGGLAVAAKTWPVLLVVGVLRRTPPRDRWRLAAALALGPLLLLLSIPLFLHAGLADAVHVLTSYRSYAGQWGWTGLWRVWHPGAAGYQGPDVDGVQAIGTALTAAAVLATVVAFRRAGAVALTAAVTLAFLVVTAGFGVQYLLWPVPYVLLLRRRTGLVFLTLASGYAAYAYWLVSPPEPAGHGLLLGLLWGSLPVLAAAAAAIPWDQACRRRPEPAPVAVSP